MLDELCLGLWRLPDVEQHVPERGGSGGIVELQVDLDALGVFKVAEDAGLAWNQRLSGTGAVARPQRWNLTEIAGSPGEIM